ncbi:MAG: hypothetical protein K2J55_01295, partial [Eubacterium sp.]|nr:hypothetical protein [Eubacterium sp.]
MKKYFKYYGICWAIAFAVFNVITFVSVGATMGFAALLPSFWIGYAFITLAFIGNLLCSLMFFKEENKNKVFLKISVIRISYSALITSFIAGVIAMAIPVIPYWVGIIVDVLILAFYGFAIVKASAAADIVNHVEQKVKEKTFFIKSLTVDADTLVSKAKSDEIKAEAKKVYEAIRYSDPMSSQALNDIEYQIQNQFKAFSEAVETDDAELVKSTANELIVLVNDRNNK